MDCTFKTNCYKMLLLGIVQGSLQSMPGLVFGHPGTRSRDAVTASDCRHLVAGLQEEGILDVVVSE
jgi:hypothetical protein